jgi:putative DNA primase/helicase
MATDYVDQVASSIIRQLKEGTAPWQKPWKPGERFMPYNLTTGNEYHGVNAMWLMSRAETWGFGDARWITFRQAQEQDAHVRKGEKGTPIQFWKWQGLEPVRDTNGKPVVDQEGQPVREMVRYERPRVWSAVVFNADQINGLPPAPVRPVLPEWERHERAETILTNAGVPIRHTRGDRAFYRLNEDTITLPERGQFPSGDRYYATALHELGHATGHPSRLARDLAHPFGSEGYAREELRAEIGSLMLGEQLGIGHDPAQHVAYVGSWIKALEQDPREIFRAAADAEKITKLIRSFELVQEHSADQDRIVGRNMGIPWQRPELAPKAGAFQSPSHYEAMITARTDALPPKIQADAVSRMVDFAAPDIVLPDRPQSRNYARNVAIGGADHVTKTNVAALYAARRIRQDDAESFMDNAVILADWAAHRASQAGLSPADALEARELDNTMRMVAWGAGHPDANDRLQIDSAGRETANRAAVAFARKSPVHAALASLIRDVQVPVGLDGSFSLGRHYLADADRPRQLRTSGIERDNPGADLVGPSATVSVSTAGEIEQGIGTANGRTRAVPEPVSIRQDHPAMQPSTPERTYLAVPFQEKDDAKKLGAKWDRAEKAWYVPAGIDLDAFTPWLPAKGSVHVAVDISPAEQFAAAIREAGLQLDEPPLMDGRLHRVPVEGDKGRNRSGAYTGHLDGRPAGFIQNHRTGVKQNWKATGQTAALGARDRAELAAEAAQKRLDRAREREQQAERTAQQVDALWTAATPTQAHPYLTDKGVQAHGLRQDETGRLMVPVQDADGRMWSVQRIGTDGFKQFEEGGRVEGGHFVIGDVKRAGPLLIAEGFATAATLHEMTDMPSIVAFNAGNLLPVAQTYRSLYPDRAIYIAGDDDRHRENEWDAQGRPKINVGRVKAEQAAGAIAGQAVFPTFPSDSRGTDWNDLAQTQGRSLAASQLRQAIAIGDREQAAQALTAARDEATPVQGRSLSRSLGQVIGRIGKAFSRDRDRANAQELGQER